MRIWMIGKTHQKITWQQVFSWEQSDDLEAVVEFGCEKAKLPRPMVLTLQRRDWENFGFCHFGRELFIESLPFDMLEVRKIIEQTPIIKLHDDE